MVIAAVSAKVPPCCVTITRNCPAVVPAVYTPALVTVPPVAVHVPVTGTVVPSDMSAAHAQR